MFSNKVIRAAHRILGYTDDKFWPQNDCDNGADGEKNDAARLATTVLNCKTNIFCEWVKRPNNIWLLYPKGSSIDLNSYCAIVYSNGVWHTFDRDGIGGWNDEAKTVLDAKKDALYAAVEQGFI